MPGRRLELEGLHSVVALLGYVDRQIRIDRQRDRLVELTVAAAAAAPLGEQLAIRRKLLDAVVACVGHIDITVVIDGHAARRIELTIPGSAIAKLSLVAPIE